MHPKVIQGFRNILVQRMHDLMDKSDVTLGELRRGNAKLSDPCDQASIEMIRSVDFSLREQDRRLIDQE